MPSLPPFVDLASLPENDRIRIISEQASGGKVVGVIVEDDKKADRYLRKLAKYSGWALIARGPGPTPSTILLRVGPDKSKVN